MNLKNFIKRLYHEIRMPEEWRRGGVYIASPELVDMSIELGKGVCIYDDVRIHSGVVIGDYTYVNPGSIIASGTIGRYCSVAFNCQIGMYNHPLEFVTTSERIYHRCTEGTICKSYKELTNPPQIGNDVWIASGSHILQGCKIGDGAVIGAGAVVTSDIPPYAIAVGIPARVIKYRFDSNTIEKLLDLKWWDKSEEWIEKYKDYFDSPENLFMALRE